MLNEHHYKLMRAIAKGRAWPKIVAARQAARYLNRSGFVVIHRNGGPIYDLTLRGRETLAGWSLNDAARDALRKTHGAD